ncbi:MAG: hypothetical protein IJ025_04910 [Clostridia bacterium]|nr:hypothetical protein [Clostridia bacterium]
MSEKWVQAWGQAHSAFSFFYYPSCKKTYRMVIKAPVSGKKLRLELSNECAKNDVIIGSVTVARCDENGSFTDDNKSVTFNGKRAFCIKQGEVLKTDDVDISISAGEYFCVSIYVEKGALRSGNLIDNVELITVKGNAATQKTIENQRRIRDSVREFASKVLRMYFHKPIPLFQSVELLNDEGASSIIVYGDSISQQGYWTNMFSERVYDEFPGMYSVINKSIMGNRLLFDYSERFFCKGLFGVSGMNRMQRDILNYSDCEYVILALGTNDFLQYNTIAAPKSEKPTVDQFFEGVLEFNKKLKKDGKKLIVFNILNFGECIDSRPEKEEMVKEFNRKLMENKHLFHGVYDQAGLCVNPEKPNCTKKEYLGKDYIHPNKKGGRIVAENVNLDWFRE